MFGFFGKRKKKEQLDQAFDRVLEKIHRIDDWDNPERLKRYILDSCKQIIDLTKELDEEKEQYKVYSDYLMDIRKLGSLNQKQSKALNSTVRNLIAAEQAKKDYENVRHKLAEEQYLLLEANSRFVPQEYKQMAQNEDDQYKLKREIQVLEGIKSENEMDREKNRYLSETMRRMSFILLAASGALAFLFLIIRLSTGVDTTWGTLLVLFFMALYVLYLYYKNSGMRRENRQIVSSLNQTISMLNVSRMKYASMTAAIDFMKKKYKIGTSYELKAMWDYFLEERQIRLKNRQDNEDYKYYYKRLVKLLGDLDLRDTNMWVDQTEALIHANEMQKVKSSLLGSREKLRSHMEENRKLINEERDEITRVMREHDFYPPELIDIVATVDKKCGLNVNYHFRKEK